MKFIKHIILISSSILTFGPSIVAMQPEAQDLARWGFSSRQGDRPTAEDAYVVQKLNLSSSTKPAYYFGLFDGHGGAKAAKYAANNAPKFFSFYFEQFLTKSNDAKESIKKSFDTLYVDLDERIQGRFNDGTTALSALLYENEVFIAWSGDSRALIMDSEGAIKGVTQDHKPDDTQEKERIKKAGETLEYEKGRLGNKWITVARVGGLAVSRTLGDKNSKSAVKKNAIIPNPEVKRAPVQTNDVIILACDGVWDVVSNKEAAQFVAEHLKLSIETLRKKFAKIAIRKPKLEDYMKPRSVFTCKGVSPFVAVAACMKVENAAEQKATEEFVEEACSNATTMIFAWSITSKPALIARGLRDLAYIKGSGDNISVMIIQVQ